MATSTPLRNVSSARRGLAIYLVGVVVLSAPLQAGIILTHAFDDPLRSILWVSALMLVPTIASVIARLIGREGLPTWASARVPTWADTSCSRC